MSTRSRDVVSTQESKSAVDERRPGRTAGGAWIDLVAALGLTVATAAATWRVLGLQASYVLVAAALHLGMSALILRGLAADGTLRGLGPADRVTLGRATLALAVMALALHPGLLDATARWWIIAVSTVVMLLDGVDGRVARRTGTATAFGARFDMELDAALLMALSVLVWRDGRVGAWVLLIGLMRYGFVAASWARPSLARELPESSRRKVVCVVQGVVLLVALGPIVPPGLAVAACAAGLAALTYSFVVDVRWTLHGPPDGGLTHGGREA
jgi:phosphatidylglycerophosphate synthase